jgi:hypothetical protein
MSLIKDSEAFRARNAELRQDGIIKAETLYRDESSNGHKWRARLAAFIYSKLAIGSLEREGIES